MGAQNKCWTLYTALCSLINSPDLELDTITVKYLEPGHTFMSADSFHHKVELSIKQCGQLHTYEGFVGVEEKVGNAVNMACSDFYSWPRSLFGHMGRATAAKRKDHCSRRSR